MQRMSRNISVGADSVPGGSLLFVESVFPGDQAPSHTSLGPVEEVALPVLLSIIATCRWRLYTFAINASMVHSFSLEHSFQFFGDTF